MKGKLLSIVLVITLILSMATITANALPNKCPECGAKGTYHNAYVTYNYGFVGYGPCPNGEPHRDYIYHLWRYTYNTCDECGFSTPRVYFEGDWSLCPGEPIPDLIEP